MVTAKPVYDDRCQEAVVKVIPLFFTLDFAFSVQLFLWKAIDGQRFGQQKSTASISLAVVDDGACDRPTWKIPCTSLRESTKPC